MTDREPTIRRGGGGGPLAGVLAVAILGLVELAIIGILIVLPILSGAPLETWRVILTAVLLTATSGIFVAIAFVREDGRLRWRWAR